MTYRFQPTRLLTPVLIFLLIAAVSYWLNPEPWHHLSATSKVLFGGAFLVVLAMIFFLRDRMHLRIDDQGIEIKYAVGQPRLYRWTDIESARIHSIRFLLIPLSSSIQLRLRPQARSTNPVKRAVSAVSGMNASFPAFFDLSSREIIERINFYKSQPQNTAIG